VTALPKEKRAIGIFNVIKFPNEVCTGTGNQDGTCYTAEECEARDGTAAGSCAEGYGVCCTVSLECGQSSSQNCTYMAQLATTTPASSTCTYTICPMTTNICRIKLDFAGGFILSPPDTTSSAAAAAATAGVCTVDTFSVAGAPTICGLNTNQHMFVDSDGVSCITPTFSFGANAVNRAYNIKVVQYDCRNSDIGGPAGCLQYHSTDTGTIASFNYNIGQAAVDTAATAVHLSNMDYKICIRQSAGSCVICYVPTILRTVAEYIADGTIVSSFGLSKDATKKALLGTACSTDWIEILGGKGAGAAGGAAATIPPLALAQITAPTFTKASGRFCGSFIAGLADAGATEFASTQICTSTKPYQIRVVMDGGEIAEEGKIAANDAGIVGFSLNFSMSTC